jgi:hypothetical protein
MSPFTEEVDKVAKAADAITSRWKVWAYAALFIGAVILALIVLFKVL